MAGIYQTGQQSTMSYDDGLGSGILGHETLIIPGYEPVISDLARNYSTGNELASPSRMFGRRVEHDFAVPLRGNDSASLGSASMWEVLLKAGAFAVDVTGSQRTYYTAPTNMATDDSAGATVPMSFRFQTDRKRWSTFTNCVTNPTLVFATGQHPIIALPYYGNYPITFEVDTDQPTFATEPAALAVTGGTLTLKRIAPNVEGACTSNGTTTLTSTSSTFLSSGVQPGDTIEVSHDAGGNYSSAGEVSAVTSETTLTHTVSASWVSGDLYRITAGQLTGLSVRSATFPSGNQLRHRSDINGTNAYGPPRIVGRAGGHQYVFVMEETVRTDQDLEREAVTGSFYPLTRFYQIIWQFNVAGLPGWRFVVLASGKLTNTYGLTSDEGGTLMRTLQLDPVKPTGTIAEQATTAAALGAVVLSDPTDTAAIVAGLGSTRVGLIMSNS